MLDEMSEDENDLRFLPDYDQIWVAVTERTQTAGGDGKWMGSPDASRIGFDKQ